VTDTQSPKLKILWLLAPVLLSGLAVGLHFALSVPGGPLPPPVKTKKKKKKPSAKASEKANSKSNKPKPKRATRAPQKPAARSRPAAKLEKPVAKSPTATPAASVTPEKP